MEEGEEQLIGLPLVLPMNRETSVKYTVFLVCLYVRSHS
jgi:hypothetical protein